MALLSGMLILAIVPAATWFNVVSDVYSTRAMRLGVSGVATFPRGWHIEAGRWGES
jgi:hypothetical protein